MAHEKEEPQRKADPLPASQTEKDNDGKQKETNSR